MYAIQGILDGRDVRGWVGNSSASPSSILHNISVITTAADCPLTRALLLDTAVRHSGIRGQIIHSETSSGRLWITCISS